MFVHLSKKSPKCTKISIKFTRKNTYWKINTISKNNLRKLIHIKNFFVLEIARNFVCLKICNFNVEEISAKGKYSFFNKKNQKFEITIDFIHILLPWIYYISRNTLKQFSDHMNKFHKIFPNFHK